MAYQLSDINIKTVFDPEGFVKECDAAYNKRVDHAADLIVKNTAQSPIVLLSGPSGSGKTTTSMENGIRYVPEYTNAVLSCEVIESFDLDTQMLFIANVVEAKVLSGGPSCTYAYYHAHIKPKKAPSADQPEGWVCTVCGYFYEGHELPKDFICPICKHGAEVFQYVPAVTHEKKKGFLCSVCGHFEPYDGDKLPDDYVCPVCHHGPEVMEDCLFSLPGISFRLFRQSRRCRWSGIRRPRGRWRCRPAAPRGCRSRRCGRCPAPGYGRRSSRWTPAGRR